MSKEADFNDLINDFFGDDSKKTTPPAAQPPLPASTAKSTDAEIDIDALLGGNTTQTPPATTQNRVITPPPPTPRQQPPVTSVQNALPKREKNDITGGSIAMPMTINPDFIAPRSMEVDEILSYVPNWMIQWGNTVILVLLAGILFMSYLIKYPDVAAGNIKLISDTPPIEVVAKASGPVGLIKKDKSPIKKGKTFAYIKNDAEIFDVKELKKHLKILNTKIEADEDLTDYELPTGLNLGMLQNPFSALESAMLNGQLQEQTASNDTKRKENIRKQLKQMKKIQRDYEERAASLKKGYKHSKTILEERYKPLYQKGSISREQYDIKEEQVNAKNENYQMAKSSLNEHKKRIIELTAQLDELDFTKSKNELAGANAIGLAVKKLENEIKVWENRYLLRAPVAGRLNYLRFVKNDLFIEADRPIAGIAPMTDDGKSKVETVGGELLLPASETGKVKLGQVVNITLDAYPKKEYGVLVGEVTEISDVKTSINSAEGVSDFYKVNVELVNGLSTTMRKDIEFRHDLGGNAEVITKDKRLIERFFYEMRDVLDLD